MLAKYKTLLEILILGSVLSSATALKLPSYLKPCALKDPNLGQCILQTTTAAWPTLIKGDRKYDLPPMNPLFIEKIDISQRGGLNLFLQDTKVYGVEDVVFTEVKFDFNKHKIKFACTIPKASLIGSYKIDGKILVLPIKGEGPSNITLTDLKLVFLVEYDLKKKEDGKEYLVPKGINLMYDTSRLHVKLENLFDGNQALSETTNTFLDANWKELVKELGPAFAEAIQLVFERILTNLGEKVPYEDLWEH